MMKLTHIYSEIYSILHIFILLWQLNVCDELYSGRNLVSVVKHDCIQALCAFRPSPAISDCDARIQQFCAFVLAFFLAQPVA